MGLGVKLPSELKKSKFASFFNVFASCESCSSNDMWSLVLVPVLDEKLCQQLLWDVEDSGGEGKRNCTAVSYFSNCLL